MPPKRKKYQPSKGLSKRKIKSFLKSAKLPDLPKALPSIKIKRIYAVPQKMGRWQKSLTKTERTDFRRFLYTLFAIFSFLFLSYFLGIRIISRLPVFFSPTAGVSQTQDKIPPPPPTLFTAQPFTNKENSTIEGFSEKGAEITLFQNNQEIGKTLTTAEGKFSFEVRLIEGKNIFHATAQDPSGNLSNPSANLETVYDKTAPKLEVSEPAHGATLTQEEPSIKVKGLVEPGASVFINGAYATVQADGSFSSFYTLTKGENTLTIEAVDKAGNKSKIIITVTYSPPDTEAPQEQGG